MTGRPFIKGRKPALDHSLTALPLIAAWEFISFREVLLSSGRAGTIETHAAPVGVSTAAQDAFPAMQLITAWLSRTPMKLSIHLHLSIINNCVHYHEILPNV